MTGIERELKNETLQDTVDALGTLEDDLNRIAEETGAEYVTVRLEPLTKEQRDANKAVQELTPDWSEERNEDHAGEEGE